MEALQAIFFDLDNTLVDYQKADIDGLKSLLKILPPDIEEPLFIDLARQASSTFHELADQEKVERNNLRRYRLLHALNHFNIPWEERYLSHFWQANLDSIAFFPGVKEALGYLKERFFVGIVSNAFNPQEQRLKLAKLNLARWVDEIVLCSEIGVYKPAKEAFLYLIKKHGFNVSSCVYVGDSEKYDVVGAKEAGLLTIKVNAKSEATVADYQCANLIEVQKLFQKNDHYFSKFGKLIGE